MSFRRESLAEFCREVLRLLGDEKTSGVKAACPQRRRMNVTEHRGVQVIQAVPVTDAASPLPDVSHEREPLEEAIDRVLYEASRGTPEQRAEMARRLWNMAGNGG